MKRKEIDQLQAAGLISAEQAVAIAEHFHLNGGRRWNWLVLSMSTLAGGLILGGIIMLISANWESIPDVVKMAVAMALLLGFWVAWARTRETYPWISEGLGLVGGGMWLGCIALYGQIFQLQNPFAEGCALFFLGVCAIPFIVRQRLLVVVVAVASAVLLGALLDNRESWLSLRPWISDDSTEMACWVLLCMVWWLLGEHWRTSAGACRSYAWIGMVAILHFLFIAQISLLYQAVSADENPVLPGLLLAVPLLLLWKPKGVDWPHWGLMMALLSLPYPIGLMLKGSAGGRVHGRALRVCHGRRVDVSGSRSEAPFLAELRLADGLFCWDCADCKCAGITHRFGSGADNSRSADAGAGVAVGKTASCAGKVYQGECLTLFT